MPRSKGRALKELNQAVSSPEEASDSFLRAQTAEQRRRLSLALDPLCPHSLIHIIGPPGSQKEESLDHTLTAKRIPSVRISLVEACGDGKLLLGLILSRFRSFQSSEPAAHQNPSSFSQFLRLFQGLIDERGWQSWAIVLKDAERLESFGDNILPFLNLLPEKCGPGTLILLSQVELGKCLKPFTPLSSPPLRIHFPALDDAELLEKLRTLEIDLEEDEKEILDQFLKNLLNLFRHLSRDPREVSLAAEKLWPGFIRPRREGDEERFSKLWLKAGDSIAAAINAAFLRKSLKIPEKAEEEEKGEEDERDLLGVSGLKMPMLELPSFLRWLLLAAYCASYNPTATDKRFFTLGTSGRRRVAKAGTGPADSNGRLSAHGQGPKIFGLERLAKILRFLTADKMGRRTPQPNLLPLMGSLVAKGLLGQASAPGNLDAPKYRCLIHLQTAKVLARSVDFDLTSHLHDFASD